MHKKLLLCADVMSPLTYNTKHSLSISVGLRHGTSSLRLLVWLLWQPVAKEKPNPQHTLKL